MTARELFEAIGLVEDALVLEADAPAPVRPRRWVAVVRRAVPLAACLCVAVGAALALRGGLFGGGVTGNVSGEAVQRDAAAAEPAPAAAEGAADAGGTEGSAEAGLALPEPEEGNAPADGAPADAATKTEEANEDLCALPRASGDAVLYWGSQLEPELQAALWADGEPERWQDVLADLPAEVQPDAEPDALPVLRGGESLGEYTLLDQSDAQTLLFDGMFLSGQAVPRGATNPDNALPAELVYNPANAPLRVPMWAFTVSTGADSGEVVCYVPAIEPETLRVLVVTQDGG